MAVKQFPYNKKEKLKSRKQLQQLFTGGKSLTVFPLKVFYILNDEQDTILKTGVGTSNKNFKKAVDRNRVKRLLREAYRKEKIALAEYLEKNKKHIALFFLYIDNNLPEYNLMKEKMQQAIKKLIHALNEMAS